MAARTFDRNLTELPSLFRQLSLEISGVMNLSEMRCSFRPDECHGPVRMEQVNIKCHVRHYAADIQQFWVRNECLRKKSGGVLILPQTFDKLRL